MLREKSKLRQAVVRRKSSTLRKPKFLPGAVTCEKCKVPVIKRLAERFDGSLKCNECFKKEEKVKTRVCVRCLVARPLTVSGFYYKARGAGFMSTCRSCRDGQLARKNQRICGRCWKIMNGSGFSPEEWDRPFQEIPMCLRCECKRVKPRIPQPGERYCTKCLKYKDQGDFYVSNARVSPYCKSCTSEYNRSRSKRLRKSYLNEDRRTPKTLKHLYHLNRNYTEQELVDLWASGGSPEVPDNIIIPEENFDKGSNKDIRDALAEYERMLGVQDESKTKTSQEEKPRKKGIKIKIAKRKSKGSVRQ